MSHFIFKSPRFLAGFQRALEKNRKASLHGGALHEAFYLPENDEDGSNFPDIKEGNLTQKLDHFGHSTNVTFQQRYWLVVHGSAHLR